jgi:hypothetical protein
VKYLYYRCHWCPQSERSDTVTNCNITLLANPRSAGCKKSCYQDSLSDDEYSCWRFKYSQCTTNVPDLKVSLWKEHPRRFGNVHYVKWNLRQSRCSVAAVIAFQKERAFGMPKANLLSSLSCATHRTSFIFRKSCGTVYYCRPTACVTDSARSVPAESQRLLRCWNIPAAI